MPSGEYECITNVALFTSIRQMAGNYVHATHSLFYYAYYADIFSLVANQVNYTDIATGVSSQDTCLTATGTHMPYGITQYYLPLGKGDIPAFTPAEAGTRLSDPGGMQGWVDLVGWLQPEMVYPPEDGHPSKL